METILNITMGMLGIALYSVFKAREYWMSSTFSVKYFLNDNWKPWVWALSIIAIVVVILLIEPLAAAAIKQLTGLDLENTKIGFLTMGAGLSALTKNTTK